VPGVLDDDPAVAGDHEEGDSRRGIGDVVAGGRTDRLLEQPVLGDPLVVQQQDPGHATDDHQHHRQRRGGLRRQGQPCPPDRRLRDGHAEPSR
jgi:hypothetical protein